MNTQKKKSPQPNSKATSVIGRTNAAVSRMRPASRCRCHARYASGSIVVAATCLANVAAAAATPDASTRSRSASSIAAHINVNMNTSKFAA